MKKLSKLVSLMLSLVLCVGMAAPAFAIEYQIDVGNVYVESDDDGNTLSWQEGHASINSKESAFKDKNITITQTDNETATSNTITVRENVTNTTITLQNVNIDVSATGDNWTAGEAALSIGKDSDVTVELEGDNTLQSGYMRAGLELKDGASVTIESDKEKQGSLAATGGEGGAGIGTGGYQGISGDSTSKAGDITIKGYAEITTAQGGWGAAGIGSGLNYQEIGDITIKEYADVTAIGGYKGAGIGSGDYQSKAGNISIQDDATVNASSVRDGVYAAGIGAGDEGIIGNISISDRADVTAAGAKWSAGIGIGAWGVVGDITIKGSDTKVTATRGEDAKFDIGKAYPSAKNGTAGNIDVLTLQGDGSLLYVRQNKGNGYPVNYLTITPPAGQTLVIKEDGSADIPIGCTMVDGRNPSSIYSRTLYHGGKITADKGYTENDHVYGDKPDKVTPAGCEGWQAYGSETYTCTLCGAKKIVQINPLGHDYRLETTPPTCTEDGKSVEICNRCGKEKDEEVIPSYGGHDYQVTDSKPATCEEDGYTTYTCSRCPDTYTDTIPATGHSEGVWRITTPAGPGVEGVETLVCPDCGKSLGETRPIPALPVPAIPDTGADTAPDAATIADQEVPLAGLTPVAQLLEELRKYEKVEDIELPEDFKWIDHEYAQAIYWGLQEALVVDTEEEPLDPDEVITVAILRDVLTNFVAYKGSDFVVTVEGEDDEIVFDLGERLTAFYGDLEAYLKAQKTKAA